VTFDIKDITAEIVSMSTAVFHISVPKYQAMGMEEIKQPAVLEIRKKKKKRSLNANAYFWEIAGKLAEKLETTPVLVYQQAIKDVGVYRVISIDKDIAKDFCEEWGMKGLGWVAEVIPSNFGGKVDVMCYRGSSTYSTSEMARLIDWVVDEAKEQGIETATPAEIAMMKKEWGQSDAEQNGN